MSVKELSKKLKMEKISAWEKKSGNENEIFEFCEGYKNFLDFAKTERKAFDYIYNQALENGFKEFAASNDKFFITNRNKSIALVKIGSNPIKNGIKFVVSHIDSPRLDLKQNPLYEDAGVGLFRTHYYGGIKKYHWVSIPLSMYATIITKNGEKLEFTIGEEENDPVFTITDLLPHLARKTQGEKKVFEAIHGEKLVVVLGGIPVEKEGEEEIKDAIKLNILKILNEKYGIVEEDFLSAEIEIVPSFKAKDVGIDRSFIGAYGQDDRVCAYTSLRAFFDALDSNDTIVALFADKEEIGSDGNTGAKARFLEYVGSKIIEKTSDSPNEFLLKEVLFKSKAISADVNGALDPVYQDVHEKQNAAIIGYGVCVTKFTGSGGKYSANDAHAEFVGWIRKIFNENRVCWQTGELGRIDEGGGGTVAKFLAEYGMDVIDIGTALLGMHSPFELSSKVDVFETYNAYKVFYKS
jgi:aspartyl aminopeptidase